MTTIMILNYHHRLADSQPMPNWVNLTSINDHDNEDGGVYNQLIMKSTNVDVKIVTILVAKVRILFLEWIARLLRMQRRREMMTRKCNNILVDGRDQELLMITKKC